MNWHPLVQRLVDQFDARPVAPESLQTWLDAPGEHALLLSGDPVRFPEALDVAVVLPELHAALGQSFTIGAVPADCEDLLARRLGVQRWPALVFFRDGQYLTTLSGMFDWTEFVQRVQQALQMPPSRRPGIGIPVVTLGADSHCH